MTRKEEQGRLEFEKGLTEQTLEQEKEAAEAKWMPDFEHQQKLKVVQQTVSSTEKLQQPNAQIDNFEVHWYTPRLGEILGSV